MRLYFLATIFILGLSSNCQGQSIGVNLVNHFSFQRDILYSPGLDLNFETILSQKFDFAVKVGYGENIGSPQFDEFKLDYKRTIFKLELNYVISDGRFNIFKVGFAPSFEFESFHQVGRNGRYTEDFTNKGVGIGIPVIFQSQALAKSSLLFNLSVTPAYLYLFQQEGKNAKIFDGNRENDIYVDLSLGIAYIIK